MKTKFYICLIILLSLSCSAHSSEWDYHSTRIPTDDISLFAANVPKINDSGNVVFENFRNGIYFWNKITLDHLYSFETPISFGALNINNSNDIVWDEGSILFEPPAYIYLNGDTISSDSQIGILPTINNKGEVAWVGIETSHYLGYEYTTSDIYFWDKTNITYISSGGVLPIINDNSHICWTDGENLFVWNGSIITQVTNNTDSNLRIDHLAFNNNGDIAYVYNNNELFLYDGVSTLITDNCLSQYFNMNDFGEIVWDSGGDESDIYIYKNGETSQVTDDPYINGVPDINNNGEIVYIQIIDNERSVIIATPIPEPSVVFLFFLGSLFLVRKKR